MNLLKIIKEYTHSKPKTKKLIGVIVIVFGLIAMITPVVPGAWVVIIGLELFGVKLLYLDKIKAWIKKHSTSSLSNIVEDIQQNINVSNKTKRILFIIVVVVIFGLVSPFAVGYLQ